jgi:hypothetical protein
MSPLPADLAHRAPGKPSSPARRRGRTRVATRVMLALAAAGAFLLLTSEPASAHGGPGTTAASAGNYRSRVVGFTSPIAGINVRVVEGGDRLEATNTSDRDLVILGYQDEPYLLIRHDEVLENLRSPATYVNQTTAGAIEAPADADPTAAPDWKHLSKGPSTRWHDHRAHWMGVTDPPVVTADPGVEQVINDHWIVPITVDGQRIDVTGDLVWIPGPNPAPWVALVVGLVLVAAAGAFTRRWRAVTLAVAVVLIAACLIDVYGEWITSGSSLFGRIVALSFPVAGFSLVVAGVSRMSRKPTESTILLAAGGALLAALFGWASRSFLVGSQLPTELDPTWSRASVSVAAGLGVGLIVMAVIRQRLDQGVVRPGRPAGSSSLLADAAAHGTTALPATATATGASAPVPRGRWSSTGRQLVLMAVLALLALLVVVAVLLLTRSDSTIRAGAFGRHGAVSSYPSGGDG